MRKTIGKTFCPCGNGKCVRQLSVVRRLCKRKGLCMAGLNFNGYAKYSLQKANGKYNIAPHEIIPWILCHCRTVDEAVDLMRQTQLVAMSFSPSLPIATLHWHIADKSKSAVVECTEREQACVSIPWAFSQTIPVWFPHGKSFAVPQFVCAKPIGKYQFAIKTFQQRFRRNRTSGRFFFCFQFVKAVFLRNNCFCPDVNGVQHFFTFSTQWLCLRVPFLFHMKRCTKPTIPAVSTATAVCTTTKRTKTAVCAVWTCTKQISTAHRLCPLTFTENKITSASAEVFILQNSFGASCALRWLIHSFVGNFHVITEKLQTFFVIYLRNFVLNLFHIYFQRLAENVVTKTYHVIFRYGTTVVDVIYVGPQNCPGHITHGWPVV